ncbi:MAG: A24 family peptidase [bacterium]
MNPEIAIAAAILAVAATIDWKEHRVPNRLTIPAFVLGVGFHTFISGTSGLTGSLLGGAVGLGILIVPYALSGMGAGDVKLMAAVGAWVGAGVTLHAFLWIAVLGGAMGVYSILRSGQAAARMRLVLCAAKNLFTLQKLDTNVNRQAPPRILLPYGVPIALGFYAHFIFGGLI